MVRLMELLGIVLFPLSLFHLVIIKIRHFCYDSGIFKSCKVDLPVISVGNIQIGGTGKTPLVEKIISILKKNRFRPVIISRGYGRKDKKPLIVDVLNRNSVTPQQIGDEPSQYLQNFPDIILGIDSNRCRVARRIKDQYPDAVIVLDDALQHRKIHRDLELITIDGSRWSNVPLLFPFTAFRDIRNSLKGAAAVIFTGAGQAGVTAKTKIIQDTPKFFSDIIPEQLCSLNNEQILKPEILNGLKIAAISAIANPDKFYATLKMLNAEIVYKKSFRDHHDFRTAEIQQEIARAKNTGAELIVTTQKDAVKLATLDEKILPEIHFLKVSLEIENHAEFEQLILEKLKIFRA